MRRRVLILMAALALAVLSGVAVLQYARTVDREAVAGRQGVWVLIAADRIPAGTTGAEIRRDDLADRVLMPASTVPPGTVSTIDAALDTLRLTVDLEPRQLLLRGHFATSGRTDGALPVPPGMVAVSVGMRLAAEAADQVTAGDDVTVFLTRPGLWAQDRKQETRILLPRVQVITIGHGVDPAPDATADDDQVPTAGDDNGDSFLVTLAVNQDDAERLVHATYTGTLYLGVLDDTTDIRPGRGVDDDGMFS